MRSSRKRLGLAGLACLWLACLGAGSGGRITVPAEVVVSEDPVRLRDIALLEGAAAEVVGDMVVVSAPGAGETRTIDGARLLASLQQAGIDLKTITYTVPTSLRVRRASQDVPEATVRGIVEDHVRDMLGAGADDAVLRTLELPGVIRVPAGAYTTRVTTPRGSALMGRVRLQVDFLVDDRVARTAWVTADVARFGEVAVPTRAVARGEVLTAADVSIDRQDLSQLPRNLVSAPEDLVGMVARASLLPWAPVRTEQVGRPTLVHRGDAVVLVVARGALRVTVPGEVRQDAAEGERVAVLNRSSGKNLIGRVVDRNTVAVEF
ncbi:MAG TPA: flagellar basal body P-ring formation chaperone FlgA [Candidatus Binatia bacterium]|jgi:flagella basal body P-ring formation protein FlgA|nr:flagellar basal body P-ring formation chaperone FlgA [Candidatus Binatia bacterium]